ncbi:nucleoside triphosphate hydrolase, partial [Bacillus pseudomycoides]
MKEIILPILMSTMFIVPAVSHAEENVVSQNNTDTIEQVQEKSGWVQDKGNWYYYNEDGTMAKSWKDINGSWYYFE